MFAQHISNQCAARIRWKVNLLHFQRGGICFPLAVEVFEHMFSDDERCSIAPMSFFIHFFAIPPQMGMATGLIVLLLLTQQTQTQGVQFNKTFGVMLVINGIFLEGHMLFRIETHR